MMKTFVATAAVAVALASASIANAQTRGDSDSWRSGDNGQRYSDDRGDSWRGGSWNDRDDDRGGWHDRMHMERHGQRWRGHGWGHGSMMGHRSGRGGSMGAMGRYHDNALWCVPVDEDDSRWGGGWGGSKRGGFWCVTAEDKLDQSRNKWRDRSKKDDNDDDDDNDSGNGRHRL